MNGETQSWTLAFLDAATFQRDLRKLSTRTQATIRGALELLARDGLLLMKTTWLKSLGSGLYEFRINRTIDRGVRVVYRVFCSFQAQRVILVISGYDKLADPSIKRQNDQIQKARSLLNNYKNGY